MDAPLAPPLPYALSFDCPDSMIHRLMTRYAEPYRRYHTWTHVRSCLLAVRSITEASLPEVELALLFHDAVYDPMASDNEERSAELLLEEGRRAWLDDRLLRRAQQLVLATAHHGADSDAPEVCIVIDADLSILGAEKGVFDAYEQDVRQEFAQIDDLTWNAGRARVLLSFLERPAIFGTRRGQRLWEARARENLAASVQQLSTGGVVCV